MAAETLTATSYISHHLTNWAICADSSKDAAGHCHGFWTLHFDSWLIAGGLGMLVFFGLAKIASRATSGVPTGWQNFFEMVFSFVDQQVRDALSDDRLAEEAFRQSYSPYLRQSGNLHYQAYLATYLGNVLLKQERFVEAEAYMRQGVTLWRQMNDDLSLANAVGSLGEVLVAQGDAAAAIPLFDEALVLLKRFQEHSRAKGLQELFEDERKKAKEGLNE